MNSSPEGERFEWKETNKVKHECNPRTFRVRRPRRHSESSPRQFSGPLHSRCRCSTRCSTKGACYGLLEVRCCPLILKRLVSHLSRFSACVLLPGTDVWRHGWVPHSTSRPAVPAERAAGLLPAQVAGRLSAAADRHFEFFAMNLHLYINACVGKRKCVCSVDWGRFSLRLNRLCVCPARHSVFHRFSRWNGIARKVTSCREVCDFERGACAQGCREDGFSGAGISKDSHWSGDPQ